VNKPPAAYAKSIEYGSCIKLYAYRWNAIGTATLDPRYQLNKYLHNLVLPLRITETRPYRANYYSTTVSGGSLDENTDLDLGPASGSIALPRGLGTIPVELKVFKDKKEDGSTVSSRHLPCGVLFTVNGQVHGTLPSNFVSRKLNYQFLEDYLLLVVDATQMPADFREDFFMTSRDRLAEMEDREFVESEIKDFLKNHEGLRLLNNKRKEEAITKKVDADEPLELLQELINHLKSSLGISHMRVIGDLSQSCQLIGLMPGGSNGQMQMSLIEREKPDVLIVGEVNEWETAEYVRDARLLGSKTALIILDHSVSEEPGMQWLVEWLHPKVPGLPITHIASGDPFIWV